MADDEDGGIDKQNVLSEIAGVPAPSAPPPQAAPTAPAPAPIKATPGTIGAARRRNKGAAIVISIAALAWLVAGLMVKTLAPNLIGIAFGIAAIAVWAVEVWDGD